MPNIKYFIHTSASDDLSNQAYVVNDLPFDEGEADETVTTSGRP